MDHLPPPPYSETDIYSNAPTSPINLTPATSQADNRSLPAPSAASSIDDSVIFTPPYTPTESLHHGDHDHASSTSAAAAYFDSRPAHALSSSPPIIHTLTVSSMTEPSDLPYPEPADDYMSKDITQQDWATFVNYLFPDYTASVNNDVADRKLKAELVDERMQRLTLGSEDRSRTNMEEVDAQLEPLRQTASPQTPEYTTRLEETVAEWNQGFFIPRGAKIELINAEKPDREDVMRMPGAWIPYDRELPGGSAPTNKEYPRKGWTFGGMRADSRGFKMGPIVADNDGFRIGKTLVADSNGFRMGNMVADHSGFRFGSFVADGNGLTVGGRSIGRRGSLDDRERPCGRGRWRGHHHGRGRSHSHGRHGRRRGRSSSTSSSSSSSSTSSSVSDASVGSLPEYDDLRDQQLPVIKQSLVEWLNHPEHPITRDTVRKMKDEIKTAKKTTPPKQFDQDMKKLRREVKGLMKEFKDRKRAEKVVRKQVRKEQRAIKKAQRKERRNLKREERRKRKGKGKEERDVPPPGEASGPHPMPPGLSSAYNMPSGPGFAGPPGFGGSGFGRRGFGGRGFGGPGFGSRGGPNFSGPAARGFPFQRAASTPSFNPPPFTRHHHGPPGMAMHGGWPYTQGMPYIPGGISVPDLGASSEPISHGAESIHKQALQMEQEATKKEALAIQIRTAATDMNIGEKDRLKKLDEATTLEEEAEKCRREGDRLVAEALHLDMELARELDEENGGPGDRHC